MAADAMTAEQILLRYSLTRELVAEDLLVEALREAVSYREALSVALTELADERRRREGAEQRLRQITGIEDWQTDEEKTVVAA